MPTPIISARGERFVWDCPACGVGSSLHDSFPLACASFTEHQARHDAWAADETDGYDAAECFERALARRSA